MTFDQLAKHTHRRGVLAAIVALAFPTSTRAKLGGCADAGEACSLWVRCCSGTCTRQLFNPNVGVCGGGVFDEDDDDDLVCDDLVDEYDVTGDGTINCDDFDCQPDAQDFFDLYPGDPCDLDRGTPNFPCEHLATTCAAQSTARSRRRRRRRRQRISSR